MVSKASFLREEGGKHVAEAPRKQSDVCSGYPKTDHCGAIARSAVALCGRYLTALPPASSIFQPVVGIAAASFLFGDRLGLMFVLNGSGDSLSEQSRPLLQVEDIREAMGGDKAQRASRDYGFLTVDVPNFWERPEMNGILRDTRLSSVHESPPSFGGCAPDMGICGHLLGAG